MKNLIVERILQAWVIGLAIVFTAGFTYAIVEVIMNGAPSTACFEF
jgi:hypothetical protein